MFSTLPTLSLLLALATASAPDTSDCTAAARFLRDDRHMTAIVEPDTIDDWRTGKHTAGCRITAAGATTLSVQGEAVRFYEHVRAAGWTRTPDPRDAPTEASLRFRQGKSDCLFNVNSEGVLNTDAEFKVTSLVKLQEGETRYHLFVMCVPIAPAVPR